MKKNYFIRFGMLFIFIGVAIISYKSISNYISKYEEDIALSNVILTSVSNDYNSFNEIVPKYKDSVRSVSLSLNIYLDDFYSKNSSILDKIEIVNSNLESILDQSERMSNNCKYDLNNEMMKQKCNNFYINYEAMIVTYSGMVDEYNKVVNQYNEYASKNGKQTILSYESTLIDRLYEIYDIYKSEV